MFNWLSEEMYKLKILQVQNVFSHVSNVTLDESYM